MSPQCLPPNFSLSDLQFRKQMLFEKFQDGCQNILEILNLYVALMPPTKFVHNLT